MNAAERDAVEGGLHMDVSEIKERAKSLGIKVGKRKKAELI